MRKTVQGHWLATNLRHIATFSVPSFTTMIFKVHQEEKPNSLLA